MRLLDSSSPMQLAGCSGAGCLILFLANMPSLSHILPLTWAVAVFLLLTAVGMTLAWLAQEQLNDGIRNEKWPDEAIAPLKRLVKHSAFMAIPWLTLLALLAIAILPRHFHLSDFFWPVLWMNTILGQLKLSVKPNPTPNTGGGWMGAAPLHSDHWGKSA